MENRFFEDAAIEDEVSDVVKFVLSEVDNEIRRIWLRSQVIPMSVTRVMDRVERLVAWATCTYDGEVTAPTSALETYIPDGEPAPAAIDTWARGTGISRILISLFVICLFFISFPAWLKSPTEENIAKGIRLWWRVGTYFCSYKRLGDECVKFWEVVGAKRFSAGL
jgi:hypothetical protein